MLIKHIRIRLTQSSQPTFNILRPMAPATATTTTSSKKNHCAPVAGNSLILSSPKELITLYAFDENAELNFTPSSMRMFDIEDFSSLTVTGLFLFLKFHNCTKKHKPKIDNIPIM